MTTFLGAGLSPAGTSYAGYGSPSSTISTNKTVLIDDYGLNGNVRLIDPVTMDYKFDDDGNIVGGDGIQQMVYLALLTVKNSSVIANFGQAFTNIKVIGDKYKSKVVSEVNSALKSLVDQKKISIVNIDIKINGTNQTRIHIVWKNLTTNTEQTNII